MQIQKAVCVQYTPLKLKTKRADKLENNSPAEKTRRLRLVLNFSFDCKFA